MVEVAPVLIFTFVVFLIFILLFHYGVKMTLWASITCASLISLVALNLIYTPYQVAQAEASAELALLIVLIILGIINVFIFTFCKGIETRRKPTPCD